VNISCSLIFIPATDTVIPGVFCARPHTHRRGQVTSIRAYYEATKTIVGCSKHPSVKRGTLAEVYIAYCILIVLQSSSSLASSLKKYEVRTPQTYLSCGRPAGVLWESCTTCRTVYLAACVSFYKSTHLLLHTELEANIDHQLLYLIEYFVCHVTIFLGGGFDLC
jgi:hypothetical protein